MSSQNRPRRPRGGSRCIALVFLQPRCQKGMGGERHTPAALPPAKRPGTHCIGGWVSPRAGLDGCGKSRPHRDSIPGPSSLQRVDPLYSCKCVSYTNCMPRNFGQNRQGLTVIFNLKYGYTNWISWFARFCHDSPPVGPGAPHSRRLQITHSNAPQSVRLLWTSDQLVADTST